MKFFNRQEAGALLGERLVGLSIRKPLFLALPRGGVPVAFGASRILGAPIDVLVVRKLGVPWHEELGMGAVCEDNFIWIEQKVVNYAGVLQETLDHVVAREKKELQRRIRLYRHGRPLPSLRDRNVVLIDDGIAMGVTARVACSFLQSKGASKVILAVPVCSSQAANFLREQVDQLVSLYEPDLFEAVADFYERFEQTTDEEVIALLAHNRLERKKSLAA